MAGSIKGITVEIGGNTTGLSKALGGVNKEINSTQSELKQVEKLLKLDPTNTTLLAQKQELLAKSISSAKDKLDTLKTAQEQVEKQFAGGEIDEGQYRAFQREIVSAENQLKKFEGNLNSTETQMKDMGDSAKDTEGKVDKLGDSAKTAGDKAEKGGKGFEMFKSAAGAIGKGLMAIGSAGIAAGGALAKIGYEAGVSADDINTLSKQTGISTNEIQRLQYATDLIDIPLETVTGSLAKLTKNMNTAASGSGSAYEAFKTLGVSITDTNGALRNNKDVFNDAINALGSMENETQRDALAMQIFGKSAQDLNPLILGGADALQELGDNAEAAGLILSQDALNSANAFNDCIDTLKANTKGALLSLGTEIGTQLLPMITSATDEISNLTGGLVTSFQEGGFTGLIDEIGNIISELLTKITEQIPNVINIGMTLIQSLIDGIQSSLPQITSSASNILTMFLDGILEMLPQLLQIGIDIIVNLINGISQQLPELFIEAAYCITELVNTLLDNIDQIIDAGINLILALIDGLIYAIPMLVEKAPEIVEKLCGALIRNFPKIINAGGELIGNLIAGIVGNFPDLIAAARNVVSTVKETLINLFTSVIPQTGKHLVEGIFKGISDNKLWLLSKLKEWCTSVLDGIKAFFGIHSPSRYTAEFGKYLVQGLAVGITEDMSAEKALEQKCKNLSDILKDFTDTSDLIISGAEKEYNLWEMQNQNATEDEKLAKKAQMLTKQLNNQEDKIKATNDALWECRQLTGENSDESLKLKNQLLDEQIAYEKLTQSINENSQARAENNASKYAAFLDYKDKFGGYLNSVGISDSEIDAAARKSSGYTGTTVVNNNYGVTPQTAYTVAQGTKRTLNNLVMAGVV